MTFKSTAILLFLTFIFNSILLSGQCITCEQFEKELIALDSKMERLQNSEYSDSLEIYSEQFTNTTKEFIRNNPATLNYKFQSLTESRVFFIATSEDGLFRIYSWDDQLGGTMRFFRNIFQYKTGGQVFTKTNEKLEEDRDPASFYSQIYSLSVNNVKYYLAIDHEISSSKDVSQSISIFTIKNKLLSDSVKLIKTASGLTNKIRIEFDFFSVVDRPERPTRLITYDERKRIIYIPIVLEDGKVTNRFILYKFTGQYFEKILTQKVAPINK